jgi:hypothetical protein
MIIANATNWGSIADWISGLGSLSAVITALYLSRETQRIKLQGYCGIRLVVGGGEPQKELIFLSVTNIGHRTTVVNNIGMRVGRIKKRFAIITSYKDLYSDGIPVNVADGEVVKWSIPLINDKEWIRDLANGFVKSESDARSLRFCVYTTHGTVLTIKPEKQLVKEICLALKSKCQTTK